MNRTTFEKIRSATPFLLWFRGQLSPRIQRFVLPHLDKPQQLALTILSCCSVSEPRKVKEIAQLSGVSGETVRQVLLALKAGGAPLNLRPSQEHQPARGRTALTASLEQFSVLQDPATSVSEAYPLHLE